MCTKSFTSCKNINKLCSTGNGVYKRCGSQGSGGETHDTEGILEEECQIQFAASLISVKVSGKWTKVLVYEDIKPDQSATTSHKGAVQVTSCARLCASTSSLSPAPNGTCSSYVLVLGLTQRMVSGI